MLKEMASEFVSAITNSLFAVPYGIRWLCSTIVCLVKEKYPNVGDTNITSLIGGFFLLRFLNPAIVTPHAFMLVSKPPSQCARRNLTLIAKLLQSMANRHVVGSHFKEEYMQPLQTFAMTHVADVQNFLMKLFKFNEIKDFYETLEIEQYLSLSKDIKIKITPNEMYRIHELIIKHKEELALTEDDPLHIILDELGPPGKQLSYSMNATICLTLTNRWDHSKVLRSESIEMLMSKKLPAEEKSIREQLKALCVKLLSLDVKFMEERSLVGTYKHHREESDKLIKDADFLHEIKQEVQHKVHKYFQLKPKVNSLRQVYETLLKQEAYLKDQLNVYKEYLVAVRAKAVTGSSKREVNRVSTSERTHPSPVSFSYSQLEKEGVVLEGQRFPDKRKSELTVTIASSQPGVYQVCLRSTVSGDTGANCEVHLNLEELLELQQKGEPVLRLSEFVLLDVRRFLSLLHKNFSPT
ncbi:hypothetical protein ACROYT_G028241 [Oculina patagonica]